MTAEDDNPPDPQSEDWGLAELLDTSRPAPSPGFRGALGRRLVALDPGYGPRPPRLRLTVTGFVALGALLVLLGELVSSGLI